MPELSKERQAALAKAEELRARFREQLSAGPQVRRAALHSMGIALAEKGYSVQFGEDVSLDDRKALTDGYVIAMFFKMIKNTRPTTWWGRQLRGMRSWRDRLFSWLRRRL